MLVRLVYRGFMYELFYDGKGDPTFKQHEIHSVQLKKYITILYEVLLDAATFYRLLFYTSGYSVSVVLFVCIVCAQRLHF